MGALVAMCAHTCKAPADCATPGAPSVDEDNWSCDAGVCAYRGCQSDAECQAVGQGPGWACDAINGYPLKVCREVCASAADCVVAGVGLYDASHWACEASRCRFEGCRADGECADAFKKPDWVCR